jgi:hypothetical protein
MKKMARNGETTKLRRRTEKANINPFERSSLKYYLKFSPYRKENSSLPHYKNKLINAGNIVVYSTNHTKPINKNAAL